MRFTVRHTTAYQYDEPVTLGYNKVHLLPRDTHRQTITEREVRITPTPNWQSQHTDYYGNSYLYFIMQEPHRELEVTITSEVDMSEQSLAQPMLAESLYTCRELRQALENANDPDLIETREFILASPLVPCSEALGNYARDLFGDEIPVLQAVSALNSRIFNEFEYDPGFTNISTPPEEVLEHKRGVCQDFAHLAIACLRSLGFPARYVSGYLETLPPEGQEKLQGADASHAWFAVFIPGHGWFDFDPTNNTQPTEQHITTAWGRDYSDVIPMCGVFFDGGSKQTLDVAVDVIRRGS